jgi:hypothetical protein
MYYLIDTTPETIEFIDRYLSEEEHISSSRNPDVIRTRWREINDYFKSASSLDIENYIKTYYPAYNTEKYNKFLLLPYWTIIADVVKLKANFLCLMDFNHSTEKLNAHHGGYEIHGLELQNVGLLVCLCEECHHKFHHKTPIKIEAESIIVQGPPIINPIFDSPIVAQDYITYKLSAILHSKSKI